MIILTALKNDMNEKLDPRFGRAAGFMLINSETEESKWLDNEQNINAAQGAGIQAASNVVQNKAKVVITGNVGPKAFQVLNQSGIEVFAGDSNKTLAENLADYKANKLTKIDQPNTIGLG